MVKTKTKQDAGSTSSNRPGSDCRWKPQQPSHQRPTQASTRPRSSARPPGSPPRPPPSHAHPQSRLSRPLSPARDCPDLGDFVKIYDTLYVFVVCKVLFLFSFGYRRGWKETHQRFKEFKNMLRTRASCFRLSSQLGILVYIVRTVWANNLDGTAAKFMRSYSFAAILSVVQAVGPVSIEERLLRVAENAFIKQQEEDVISVVDEIRSNYMSDADERLQRLYRRILSSITRFLDQDKRDHPDKKYSSRGKTMAYKLAVQLKYANMSNEAGICSEWLAVDVGRIMLSLRILQANRFFWTESGEKQCLGAWFGFEHWEYATGLSGFVGAEVLASIKAAYDHFKDIELHPFSDMFVPSKDFVVARAAQSWRGGREQTWWTRQSTQY